MNRRVRMMNHQPAVLFTAIAVMFVVLLPCAPAQAKVNSINASASPTRLELGDSFVYQVTVDGSGTLPTPSNNIPSAFQIISGPNSNISMQFINGKMSSTRTLTYTLRALRRGQHTIPSPTVKDGGRQLTGNTVTIVVEAPGSGASPQPEPHDLIPKDTQVRQQELRPIFLQADVDRGSVYLQEPIVVTFTLYFQPSVRTFDVQKLPSTEGFWSEEWEVPNPPSVVERNVRGHLYNAATIYRLVLFPTKTGKLTIGPMDLVVHYVGGRSRNRSFFDSIFDSYVEQADVESEPLAVNVRPLPEEGQPDNFENVVGNWRLDARMDADTVQTNESVTLTVSISGEGNVGFLPPPDVRVPPDIEMYEPEVKSNTRVSNGNVHGEKTFTYLLIPRRPGAQEIPPVELSYFDPKRKQYRTLKANPGVINVKQATGWAATDVEGTGAPAPVESMAREIRWIMDTAPSLKDNDRLLHQQPAYWGSFIIPALVVLAGIGVRKRRDKLAGQQSLVRSRKAAKRAITALKEARELHEQDRIEEGYNALARGLVGYLSDRLNVAATALDDRGRAHYLQASGLSDSSRAELRDIMNLCDTARFSPHGSDASTLANLIERAREWITVVDRKLGPARV